MLNYPISIFLDTNIFIEAKYDFSSKGIFSTLNKYISDGKIRLIISNIVENEVKKHLNEDAATLCNIFKDARTNVFKKFSSNILDDTSVSNLFKKIEKDALKSEMVFIFDKFIEES
ncbi:PIN domain-containing protein, partial [Clostridium sp. A1-XYC3]